MRKGNSGGKKRRRKQRAEKRQMTIVPTTLLPAVNRPNGDHSNAARSYQKKRIMKIVTTTSSPIVNCRKADQLERRTLVPIGQSGDAHKGNYYSKDPLSMGDQNLLQQGKNF